MVTLAVAAVTVTFCVVLLPTATLPKLTKVGNALNVPAGLAPVPDNCTVLVALVALLIRATLPVKLPATCGAKLTVKEVDCPGPRVAGRLKPLALKPAPVAFICEI